MTTETIDQLSRTVKDLEYRVRQLEKLVEPRMAPYSMKMAGGWSPSVVPTEQWCACGRDVCRAPECPSHKPDPMGR